MAGHDAVERERLRALASFLPRIEAPDFAPGTWEGGERQENGAIQMPWFSSTDVVDEFVSAAYNLGWVRSFDWPAWLRSEEAIQLRDNPEALATANAGQLANLLTVIIRQDRFGEGSLEEAFESGFISSILHRAKVLSDAAGEQQR